MKYLRLVLCLLCVAGLSAAEPEPAFDDPVFVPPEPQIRRDGAENAYRILFVGNSITRHAAVPEPYLWNYEAGMAASSEANDFAHLTTAAIREALPERPVELYFGNVDKLVTADPAFADPWKLVASDMPAPDLIIVQTGEHEGPHKDPEQVRAGYERLLRAFDGMEPAPRIIAVGVWYPTNGEAYSGWVKNIDTIYAEVCAGLGLDYVSVEAIATDPACRGFGGHPAVQWHPNDTGMERYARSILAVWAGVRVATDMAGGTP